MSKKKVVRRRAILLGLILIPVNTWWLIQMEEFRYSGHPTTASLFFNVIFLLLLLTLLNLLLKRFLPKAALSQAELLTIYVMLSSFVIAPGTHRKPQKRSANTILPGSWPTTSPCPSVSPTAPLISFTCASSAHTDRSISS